MYTCVIEKPDAAFLSDPHANSMAVAAFLSGMNVHAIDGAIILFYTDFIEIPTANFTIYSSYCSWDDIWLQNHQSQLYESHLQKQLIIPFFASDISQLNRDMEMLIAVLESTLCTLQDCTCKSSVGWRHVGKKCVRK